jgi:hypothetical protein
LAKLNKILQEATDLLRSGKYAEVIDLASSNNVVTEPRICYTLARALQLSRRHSEAVAAFDRCIAMPDATMDLRRDSLRHKGNVLCAQGDFISAREAYQSELRLQLEMGYSLDDGAQGTPLFSRIPEREAGQIFGGVVRCRSPLVPTRPVVIFGLMGSGRTYVTDLFLSLGIPKNRVYGPTAAHARLRDWRDGKLDRSALDGEVFSVHLARGNWLGFGDSEILPAILAGGFHLILVNRHPLDCFITNFVFWTAQAKKHLILGKSAVQDVDMVTYLESRSVDWLEFVETGFIEVDRNLVEMPQERSISLHEWAEETAYFRTIPGITELKLESFVENRLSAAETLCRAMGCPLGLHEWEQLPPPKTHAYYHVALFRQALQLGNLVRARIEHSESLWRNAIVASGYTCI